MREGVLTLIFLTLVPAAIAATAAHRTRRQATRRNAAGRLVLLVLGAGAWIVAGFLGTRGSPTTNGCRPDDCLFTFELDPFIWTATVAPAIIWLAYAIDAARRVVFYHLPDEPPPPVVVPPGVGGIST